MNMQELETLIDLCRTNHTALSISCTCYPEKRITEVTLNLSYAYIVLKETQYPDLYKESLRWMDRIKNIQEKKLNEVPT